MEEAGRLCDDSIFPELRCSISLPGGGHSLHIYWESFGKYLVLLSIVLLIPFVICMGVAINSWFFVKNLKKGKL